MKFLNRYNKHLMKWFLYNEWDHFDAIKSWAILCNFQEVENYIWSSNRYIDNIISIIFINW